MDAQDIQDNVMGFISILSILLIPVKWSFSRPYAVYFVDDPAQTVQILYIRHAKMRAVGQTARES